MELWDALDLEAVPAPPVLAVAGGGGKSSLMYRLGIEAVRRGRTAVIGGTTRFTGPRRPFPQLPRVEGPEPALVEAVAAALQANPAVIAVPGHEPKSRFAAMALDTVEAMARLDGLGLLALEADGSKLRPFKAPAEHEPVIPDCATHVCVVVGLPALGAALDEEHVHRPERVRAIVGEEPVVTAEVIASVLAHEQGGRRHVGERRYAVVINQADLDPDAARDLARVVHGAGVERVVVASLREDDPVHAVLVRP
jgi:molybdenum cofactor cytidylyltransferase